MPTPKSDSKGKVLGILKPTGGGDPIPLLKDEILIGRRRSCDICLDFNNISGKHCQLRLINSVWHVRDLGSTNGTSLNGMSVTSEKNVLPDDELAIASHVFTIDYEPGGPDSVHLKLDDEDNVEAHRHSLLELAGIESDEEKPRPRRSSTTSASSSASSPSKPGSSPAERPPLQSTSAFGDDIPEDFRAKPAPLANADDDDFLSLIEEDVKKASKKKP